VEKDCEMMIEGHNRLYRDLTWLWEYWEDPSEYEGVCEYLTSLIYHYMRRNVSTVLDLGCGGGKGIFNFKRHFSMTGVDISSQMLDLARRLNPECTFVQGDMRSCLLEKPFDAIIINDAIVYMTNQKDLYAVFQTAYRNLEPGGVMIVIAENLREHFQQNGTSIHHARAKAKPKDLEIVIVENTFDPDQTDESFETTFVYIIRDKGRLRVETDRHICGLFSLEEWEAAIYRAGFVNVYKTKYHEDSVDYPVFVGLKESGDYIPMPGMEYHSARI
jgi:SAM-dependent methyltransferase